MDLCVPDSAEPVRAFFNALELPVPERGEFYYNALSFRFQNPKRLIFLNDYGLVIRITPLKDVLAHKNPHFQLPLTTRQAGGYQISLDPGIECPVTPQQAGQISRMFYKKYNIHMHDVHEYNFGFLPGVSPFYPVAIDLDPHNVIVGEKTASKLSASVARIKKALGSPPVTISNRQTEFYRPLIRIITDAWPENGRADPQGIKDFFSACASFKREGRLIAPWQKKQNAHNQTASPAALYAERLKTFHYA